MKPFVLCRLAVLAGLLCALRAYGAQETFRIGDDASAKQAVVETASRNGVSYVPLGSLVRQFGGQAQVTPQRVTLDYSGYAALIQVNDTVVSGSLQQFALTKPVIEGGGEAWIALADVPALFRQAFGVSAVRSEAPSAEADPVAKQEQMLEMAEETPTAPAAASVPAPSAPAPTEAAPRVVVIDPGHGGNDAGARGKSVEEKALVLDLAKRVATALESGPGGLKVYLTRQDDKALPLLDRVNSAIQKGSVFMSLHAGAALNPALSGVEIYFSNEDAVGEADSGGMTSDMRAAERYRYAKQSAEFSEAVATALTGQEGIVLAGRHAVRSPLLHHVPMPGILVEVGFLTNEADEAALASPEHLDKLANAIAAGIQRYLGVAPAAPAEAPQP
jgi:N-acetylmuramoyl-L-alanine amidase